ncbi:Sugar abc transport system permease component [Thermobacillus xylanilyticus]|uniref:Sugar abc transport system permease component n=1 Tax=Thermobacillus xylanilyticus TaxID=76633 RepID=A0ABN7RV76_THEXY|nr:sugar ABC transporter permease [Thermobacillus xylanilyticus]CAG5086752.1 Sugar abc transport system permease component [Thermobacillus xylanilyticus]
MNKVMSNKAVIALYVLPSVLLILSIVYLPILFTGYYGFFDWNGVSDMQFTGLGNYKKLLRDQQFWNSAWHSLWFALMSTLSLIAYLLVALLLSGKLSGSNLLRKIYLVPMLLSSVAIAQLWLKVYHPSSGILNTILEFIGVQNTPNWLADPDIVLWAIFVPILWQYAGFYILIYYAALKNIPEAVIEAARIDGANPLVIAWRIKVPLISEVIKVTVVLAVVGSLKYFDLIYIMTGGGPNRASEVMASYMYSKAFKSFDFGYGSSIGFSLLLICLVATWLIRMLTASRDKIQYGG